MKPIILTLALLCVALPARAQTDTFGAGQGQGATTQARNVAVVTGMVSTGDGLVRLPGVVVVLSTPLDGTQIGTTVTDGDGRYRLDAPRSGTYRITTELQGFETVEQSVDLVIGTVRTLDLALRLVSFTESIDVTPSTDRLVDLVGLSVAQTIDGKALATSAISSGNVTTALRWTPGVTAYGREWAIKGGRPNQVGLQIDSAQVVDPATGTSPVQLPGDAVNAMQVLANPYAVEFGGFTSGLILVSTRSGANRWTFSVNNFTPAFMVKRGVNPFHIIGIRSIQPRVAFGGPLVKNRLLLAQSTQVRYASRDVATRPQDDRSVSRSLSSFTRLDWLVNAAHTLTTTVAIAPEKIKSATLSTFESPQSAADLRQRMYRVGISETARLPHSWVLESLVHVARYTSGVNGHGDAPGMVLTPEQNFGIYYGNQERRSTVWQLSQSLSGIVGSAFGQHVLRGGLHVGRTTFDGEIANRPVQIVRADGTLADRIVWTPSRLRSAAINAALFVQDRWVPADWMDVEVGVRAELDGVFKRVNFIPRVGAAVGLDQARRATVRGGVGYFYDRTPMLARAFGQQSPTLRTTFDAQGQPIGDAVAYVSRLGDGLKTPRSLSWNIGYEHLLGTGMSLRFNHLRRAGRHELVLQTGRQGANGWLLLDSSGRSSYRDTEIGAHIRRDAWLDFDISYTHSSSRADLNDAFGYYLDLTADPVITQNAYGPTDTDTPHRLVVRGRAVARDLWAFEVVGEVRSGFPYSAVDEHLQVVGARNRYRFPVTTVLDVSVERRFRIKKARPWIGLTFINPLNMALPVEVQRNITSPAFGSFYRAAFRQVRLTVRFRQ